ncbi:MAG TPA: hypothetical protein PK286_10425 [Devosia sp.]|nr:hypothetical protein [Devosia sp.]
MDLARYFLMRVGDRWCVTLDGRLIASYPTRTRATSAAVIMADLMGAMHYDADVVVDMGHGLPLELVWTYGRDQVPPRRPRAVESPEAETHPGVWQVQHGEAA